MRFDRWVAATILPPLAIETSVEVLDRNGALLRAFTVADGRWRLATSLDAVDPRYVEMLIAYEDKRFYPAFRRRSGGDGPRGRVRRSWNGQIVSGGSTLTMQVARLLEDGTTGRWQGKLRQIRVALALERRLSKAEILTLYLNRAPFGGNLEGVRAATRAYFGKEPHAADTGRGGVAGGPAAIARNTPPGPGECGGRCVARNRVLARLADAGDHRRRNAVRS